MSKVEKIKCPLCRKEHSNTKLEICSECFYNLPKENQEIIMSDIKRVYANSDELVDY